MKVFDARCYGGLYGFSYPVVSSGVVAPVGYCRRAAEAASWSSDGQSSVPRRRLQMKKIALFTLMAFAVPMFAQAPAQENPPKVEKTTKTKAKKVKKTSKKKKDEKKTPEEGK
jgi:hypothetical protein